MSKTNLYCILSGGNIGDVIGNINFAKSELSKLAFNRKVLESSLYKTKAWGKTDQADFYNKLFVFKSVLPPRFVMKELLNIEIKKGRLRKEKWGARTLDLDILYCGSMVMQNSSLILPHPEIQNRRFCLVPLIELLPNFIHPVFKLSNNQLLELCKDNGFVEKA